MSRIPDVMFQEFREINETNLCGNIHGETDPTWRRGGTKQASQPHTYSPIWGLERLATWIVSEMTSSSPWRFFPCEWNTDPSEAADRERDGGSFKTWRLYSLFNLLDNPVSGIPHYFTKLINWSVCYLEQRPSWPPTIKLDQFGD